jgi:hypothetical protein
MAATAETTQIERLSKRVANLEKTVVKLQLEIHSFDPQVSEIPPELSIPLEDPVAEKERILALLRAKGVIVEPGPRTKALAAEWEALSDEEKRAHREFMDSLRLDPPLSQIVMDNRR